MFEKVTERRNFTTAKNPHFEQESHYFVTTSFGWVGEPTLTEALRRVRSISGVKKTEITTALVFWVPLPADASYEVDEYRPQVDGAHFIGKVTI
jgi:hypothetical protein